MAIQKFYYLGEDASNAVEVPLDANHSLKQIAIDVAKALDLTTYKSATFQDSDGNQLESSEDVINFKGPVAVAVNNHAIRAPSGPQPLPFVGNFYEIFPDHLRNHGRLFREFGHCIKTTTNGKTVYLTNSPEIAEQVLIESPYFSKEINSNHPLYGIRDNNAVFVGDTNKNWVTAHKFASASMTGKAIGHYAPLIQEQLLKVLPVLDEIDENDLCFNAYSISLRASSQVIGKFVLAKDFHHLDGLESPLNDMMKLVIKSIGLNKVVTSRGEWFGKLPFGPPQMLREADQEFKKLITRHVQEYKDAIQKDKPDLPIDSAAEKADCLLDYFLRAIDEEGKHIPDDLMLPNLVVLFGAGFTTTSSAMSWLMYNLAMHPDCQAKLLQELIDNDITRDTKINPELLSKLTYLEKFLKESLRMNGPSFAPGRTCQSEKAVLPEGYVLHKGDVIISALYSVHYRPDIYNNPERFDPERWTPEFTKSLTRFQYMPFAAGGRSCIGFAFALQNLRIFLCLLVRYYDISRDDDEPIEYDPEFQLIRPTNLYIRARRRK